MDILLNILRLIPFYLIGAFPTGLIIAKINGIDITVAGSGNVGATNLARTIGKKAGIYTLLGDLGKGVISVLLCYFFISKDLEMLTLVALATVLGHCFSLPKLKGGKGVATTFGVILVIDPKIALGLLLIFITIFAIFRIVSLSSITAALFLPILFLLSYEGKENSIHYITFISTVVILRHAVNIKRLLKGEEKKFSFKKK
ncbi:MAG: glycerol-3-phosphate 1-O-acyltransferase PlsY [Bdellovibrionota bacterium]